VLHQVGVSFDLYYDAWKHKIKINFVITNKGLEASSNIITFIPKFGKNLLTNWFKINCRQGYRHTDITVILKAYSVLISGGKKAKNSII